MVGTDDFQQNLGWILNGFFKRVYFSVKAKTYMQKLPLTQFSFGSVLYASKF